MFRSIFLFGQSHLMVTVTSLRISLMLTMENCNSEGFDFYQAAYQITSFLCKFVCGLD